MTHDYKRHGTTTLFAALNILDGTVIGRNMQHHRHQEFIRFLNTIEEQVPVGKVIHAIVDNYATHKHPKVRQGSVQNLSHIYSGDGFGLHDLRLIERSHVHVALGGPCRAGDVAQPRGRQVEA